MLSPNLVELSDSIEGALNTCGRLYELTNQPNEFLLGAITGAFVVGIIPVVLALLTKSAKGAILTERS
jgi:hypothetical protein